MTLLRIIQIIALVQGVFLLVLLFRNRHRYRKLPFRLFLLSILAVLAFLVGDDENNLLLPGVDLFLFDSSLFVTSFFLFFRYVQSGLERFRIRDLLFFLPNLLYLALEIRELFEPVETLPVMGAEFLVESVFVAYLVYIIRFSLVQGSRHWAFYFAIPIVFLLALSSVADILEMTGIAEINLSEPLDYSSYMSVVIAFLFYFITYQLVYDPRSILPHAKVRKYAKSNLTPELVRKCRQALEQAMVRDKLYLEKELSIHELARQVGMPRQYVSEVLNVHMQQKFQDFVSGYRIRAFLEILEDDRYSHLTLFGMASEAGFNSKSTFNSSFKRHMGVTPQAYRASQSRMRAN